MQDGIPDEVAMTAQTSGDGVSQSELWHELMQFYINEAWLLDDR